MELSLHICKNCGNHFQGKYCNRCGQKIYSEKDKTLAHFFEDGIHFITHFEGTFFTTIKTMATRPGQLSLDYCKGIRKRYFKPLSLFLVLVILYLLFPYLAGLNMEMKYYSLNILYGKYASHEINDAMLRTGLTEDQLAVIFHQKSEKLSKFLLIIIIPFSALFLKAVLYRKRKYFFDYLVYATEINSVYILWGFLIFPLLIYVFSLLGVRAIFEDYFLGIFIYIPLSMYVAISARRFFKLKWRKSILLSILFFLAHFIIVLFIYKFILFNLTMIQI